MNKPNQSNIDNQLKKKGKEVNHWHNWLIKADNMRWRDIDRKEYIVDLYVCECGSGGIVKTPKEQYNKGLKTLGINELLEENLL